MHIAHDIHILGAALDQSLTDAAYGQSFTAYVWMYVCMYICMYVCTFVGLCLWFGVGVVNS